MYKADSDYTSNKAQKCKSKTDYTDGKDTDLKILIFLISCIFRHVICMPVCMWMPLISVKTKTWNYYPENGILFMSV